MSAVEAKVEVIGRTGGYDSGLVCCRFAADPDELAEHHRIRCEVFVREQRIFDGSDIDANDARSDVLRVLGFHDGVAAGAVRLYPLDPVTGSWLGDRLAVLPEFRTVGLGAPLVRFAVATAGALGGLRMIAHVQLANQRFFERLGWTCHGAEDYVGRPHVRMSIALAAPQSRSARSASDRGDIPRNRTRPAQCGISTVRPRLTGISSPDSVVSVPLPAITTRIAKLPS
jgi:putative N-acetyltransferase (TIGR04045 family)